MRQCRQRVESDAPPQLQPDLSADVWQNRRFETRVDEHRTQTEDARRIDGARGLSDGEADAVCVFYHAGRGNVRSGIDDCCEDARSVNAGVEDGAGVDRR